MSTTDGLMSNLARIAAFRESGDVEGLSRFAVELAVNADVADRRRAADRERANRRRADDGVVSPSVRWAVLHRDGFRCVACGTNARDGVWLEVDHIIPYAAGGTTSYENLQTLCQLCNGGKSDTVLGA